MMTSISSKDRPKLSGGGGDSGNTSTTDPNSSLIVTNVDMIAQILVRLPVKYLLRSKSVSKTWLSIITDPSFVRNYCVRNRHPAPGLFLNQYSEVFAEKYEFVPLDKQNITNKPNKKRKRTRNNDSGIRDVSFKTLNFLNDGGSIKIIHSCNGLFLCSHSVRNSRHKPELTAYYIYNPSTRSYKILPASPFRQDGYRSVDSLSLAFDPIKSPYYEVVCLSSNNNNIQVEIYSSKTSSWRLCKAPFEAGYSKLVYACKSGVFWNGSLHWVSEQSSVCFDIDQEILKEMPKLTLATDHNDDSHGDSDDEDNGDSMSIEYFGEYGGHLFLVQISDPHESFSLKIMEMKTDYTGWDVKYCGNLKKMTRQYPKLMLDEYAVQCNFGLDFSILLVEEKEEEESINMVMRVMDKVISYDLKKKLFKLIHKLPPSARPEMDSPAWYESYQFIESLASV